MKNFDNKYLTEDIQLIAGVDEAGRGPLAGPVVAAAVIFDKGIKIDGVDDSKKLTEKKRDELYLEIIDKSITYGIGIVEEAEIDDINILQASLKAMKIAVKQLSPQPNLILIDGNKVFQYDVSTQAIVKGDSKSFAIAAASILAKVTRDKYMKALSNKHPEYVWHKNKGYGTKEHIDAIRKYGPTQIHRRSFLSNILSEEQLNLAFNKFE